MSCGFLGGVLRNQDPLKGMRQLPHVRLSGRGVTFAKGNNGLLLVEEHMRKTIVKGCENEGC